jgi:intracellular sulfur oxidation DsrE/DsrF family protein
MKKRIALIGLLIPFYTFCGAQSKPLRIVFDVTSGDTLIHQAVIRHVSAEAKAHPDGQFEVVIYSGALNMVVKDKSVVAAGVQQLTGLKNVSFKVCSETMHRYQVEKGQLFSGVDVVPDGIVEIVEKQGAGWGYIKEAH